MMRFGFLLLLAGCSSTTNPTPQKTLIGDGTAGSTALTMVWDAGRVKQPTGLAFNPMRPEELWIVNYRDNSVITVTNPGSPTASVQDRRDPAARHFMYRPVGIDFADDDSWGTCGEGDNSQNGGTGFVGPTVFSSDPTIFATDNPLTGLGSHLDMLHASPFCMGITHEIDHAYWIFDGEHSALVRYDFKVFHPPGEDDHSDGDIRFYAIGQVKRVPNTPSHLVFDATDSQLYVADTGNARIVKLDTKSGTKGKNRSSLEPAIPYEMDGTSVVEVVPAGTLSVPSGLALHDDILYVSDNAVSRIYAFDKNGTKITQLDVDVPVGGLSGMTVGPDGKLYFVDMVNSRAHRIDVL
jgi:DNA-binding beta-propeller fold protein YncE